jgi:hypothetical protein
MTAEEAEARDPSSHSDADADALRNDVRLLHEIRDGLASEPGSEVMVEAVTGLIEERQAEQARADAELPPEP